MLRKVRIEVLFSKSMSCLFLQNTSWIWALLTISTALTWSKPPLLPGWMQQAPISSLAPWQTTVHPAGQLILDKCQSNDVTSSDFSLHPHSLSRFAAWSASVCPQLFHATSHLHHMLQLPCLLLCVSQTREPHYFFSTFAPAAPVFA